MPLIEHGYVGEIDPELLEVRHKKTALNSIMFGTIKDAARLRRVEKGLFKGLLWLIAGSTVIKSPDVRIQHSEYEPNHETVVWLQGNKPYNDGVKLKSQIYDRDLNIPISPHEDSVTAMPEGIIKYPFDDQILTPESQLEIVSKALDTVECIALTINIRLKL